MIVFVGDVHGNFGLLAKKLVDVPKDAVIIQVGDFGMWPGHYEDDWHHAWSRLDRPPLYFIDGNHECHPLFAGITSPEEMWEGAIFIPRGIVMELDGFKIGSTENPVFHSQRFILVDRQGQIRGYYDSSDASLVEQLDTDVRRLITEG